MALGPVPSAPVAGQHVCIVSCQLESCSRIHLAIHHLSDSEIFWIPTMPRIPVIVRSIVRLLRTGEESRNSP